MFTIYHVIRDTHCVPPCAVPLPGGGCAPSGPGKIFTIHANTKFIPVMDASGMFAEILTVSMFTTPCKGALVDQTGLNQVLIFKPFSKPGLNFVNNV